MKKRSFLKDKLIVIILIYLGTFLGISLILYLLDLRFIKETYYIILIIFTLLLLVKVIIDSKYRLVYGIIIWILGSLGIYLINSYSNIEEIVIIDGKKYMAVIKYDNDSTEVNLYDKVKFGLVRTKERAKGVYEGYINPFNKDIVPDVGIYETYIIYDDNGVSLKEEGIEVVVNNGEIKINTYDLDKLENMSEYKLAEDLEVLYEGIFGRVIVRFVKVDNVLGQNMIVTVVKSVDGGRNYYMIGGTTTVSLESQFKFLDEKVGFAIKNGKIMLDNGDGLDVTIDGGKSFIKSNFHYDNKNGSFIEIDGLPYYDGDSIKIKCSILVIGNNGYESKNLLFVSLDKGLNWYLENE